MQCNTGQRQQRQSIKLFFENKFPFEGQKLGQLFLLLGGCFSHKKSGFETIRKADKTATHPSSVFKLCFT